MKWNVIKYLLKSSESSGSSIGRQERISGREVYRISRNVRSNLLQSESPTEKNRQSEYRQIWKKVDVRKMFWKEGRLRVGIWPFLAWSSMVSDDVCDESCSAIFDE